MNEMILRPTSRSELTELLSNAHRLAERISRVDVGAFRRLVEHTAEDMTATVEAGMMLGDFQNELARRGQWLPVDPPNAGELSIGELLAADPSGPRRFGCGTVRDYLIGMTVALADGRFISSGGKVVKNVAGYDLAKLFIGSRGSLGVIIEATFKLRPLPEIEKFVQARCASLSDADKLIGTVLNSELTPIVFDAHNMPGKDSRGDGSSTLVLGFAGTNEEVEWQLSKAGELGFNEPSSLDYEKEFWKESGSIQKTSVLPSRTFEVLGKAGNARFVARAGNGIIYCRGAMEQNRRQASSKLAERLKNEFDPKHVLPDLIP
jgi:FAD/FMN-containing dehydrogenase